MMMNGINPWLQCLGEKKIIKKLANYKKHWYICTIICVMPINMTQNF